MASEASTFGTQLRRLREAASLSQEELAERAGLTVNAIGALERGERRRPYPHTVHLLAQALELDDERRAALIAAIPRRSGGTPPGDPAPDAFPVAAPTAAIGPSAPEGTHSWPFSIEGPATSAEHSAAPPSNTDLGHGLTAFVGRKPELAALRFGLAGASAGRGGVVMLVGEAGIGKTCLAREFAMDAASQGVQCLWGCCFEGDWQPPYGPWVEALSSYVRGCSPEDLRRELGIGAAPISRLVPEVHLALRGVPVPSPLSPDEERFRLYDAIVRFLLAISNEQPVLLVLDDLHWADPDSLRLLRHLGRFVGQARVLVVGAYRDPELGLDDEHPLMGTLSVLRRESGYTRISIRGFSRDEIGEYLSWAAGQALPRDLVQAIEEETSGNPFYAREVFRHLSEEANALGHGGPWTTGRSLRELGIPEGVRQIVGRRVSRLSAASSALLKLASGFTGSFGFDVLQALSELPEHVLLDCIDETLAAGLICACDRDPPRYGFAHAIVRDALYQGLNFDRRARLHRRIAIALEGLSVGGEAEASELAWQYHASAALPGAEKGIAHALEAAEKARAAYAHERAATFLRMARDLAMGSPAGERADILRRLAVAEAESVELEKAQRSVEEALQAMTAAGVEARAQAEFLIVAVRALKDGGAVETIWEPLVQRGLASVGDERSLLWARLTLLQDGFDSIESGPIGGRQWRGSDPEAIAIARAEGDEEDYARTLNSFDRRTREETEAVLSLARRWTHPVAVMRALDAAGSDLLYWHSAFQEARTVYQELLEVAERYGSISSQAEALARIVICEIVTGDLLLGQKTLQRAAEAIGRLGPGHWTHTFALISRKIGLLYFLDGDWSAVAKEAAEYATGPQARRSPFGLVAAALAALSQGRVGSLAEARGLLIHLTLVVGHGLLTAYFQSVALVIAAIAVWELETTEHAATYRRLALELLDAGVGYEGFGPLELFVARMSVLLGDFGEAEEYFGRARRKLDAQGLGHYRAIVDYDQACALIRAGATDRARIAALLSTALGGFRSYGMHGWVCRASGKQQELAGRS